MSEVIIHKISKFKLIKIDEDDLMFITNPGRMGDEDGMTFIIKDIVIFFDIIYKKLFCKV